MAMFETIFPFWTKAQFQWGPREVGLSFTYLAVVVGTDAGLRGRPPRARVRRRPARHRRTRVLRGGPGVDDAVAELALDAGRRDADLRRWRHVSSRRCPVSSRSWPAPRSAAWCSAPISRPAGRGRSLGPVMSGTLFNALGPHSPLLAGAINHVALHRPAGDDHGPQRRVAGGVVGMSRLNPSWPSVRKSYNCRCAARPQPTRKRSMYINFWYPMATTAELTDKPLRVRALAQDFVVFRDAQGKAHCLANTCTHRGGSLAGGKVNGDHIECPYHGWQFNGEGQCKRIPSLGVNASIPGPHAGGRLPGGRALRPRLCFPRRPAGGRAADDTGGQRVGAAWLARDPPAFPDQG